MGKIKHIYVTGDSFSFGQELGPPPTRDTFYEFTPYMRSHSYTGLIADAWSVAGYTNDSRSGSANDRIFRRITTELPILLDTYLPSEIFVFISMTHPARRELFYSRDNRWLDLMPSYGPMPSSIEYEMWRQYTTFFNHITEHTYRFASQLLAIQQFLKSLGIDYLITDSMHFDHDRRVAFETLPKSVKELVDYKHYHNYQSFSDYVTNAGLPMGDSYHPLEDGHAAWAKYLMEYMKQHNIGQQ